MHRVRTESYGVYRDFDDEFELSVKQNEIIADYFSIKVIYDGVNEDYCKQDTVWEGTHTNLEMFLAWRNRDSNEDNPEPVLSKRLREIQKQWDEWQWPSDADVIIPHPDTDQHEIDIELEIE